MAHITKHTLYHRRALRNLQDARDALDLYLRCLDEVSRVRNIEPQYLERARCCASDLNSDIHEMLAELKEERSAA